MKLPDDLSPLASSVIDEVSTILKKRYDVDFQHAQIVSAVITAQGVEGCASVFGLLFAPNNEQRSLDLGDEPPLDRDLPLEQR
jgi:hypothetical protein